jgi:hypothetical protein
VSERGGGGGAAAGLVCAARLAGRRSGWSLFQRVGRHHFAHPLPSARFLGHIQTNLKGAQNVMQTRDFFPRPIVFFFFFFQVVNFIVLGIGIFAMAVSSTLVIASIANTLAGNTQ